MPEDWIPQDQSLTAKPSKHRERYILSLQRYAVRLSWLMSWTAQASYINYYAFLLHRFMLLCVWLWVLGSGVWVLGPVVSDLMTLGLALRYTTFRVCVLMLQ